jgi:predicted anti-sigma-YlaC factor YlaD
MKEISCDVFRDLFLMYLDGTASQDTRDLVEEHLAECQTCREIYEEMKEDFLKDIHTSDGLMVTRDSTEELYRFKRFLNGRNIRTAILSAVCAAALLVGAAVFMNQKVVPIDYEDAGIQVYEESEDAVYYKTSIRGNYHWNSELDINTGVSTRCFAQSLWEKYVEGLFFPFDHIHMILKKDVIKEVYLNEDGTEEVIWEAAEEEKENYFKQPKDRALG